MRPMYFTLAKRTLTKTYWVYKEKNKDSILIRRHLVSMCVTQFPSVSNSTFKLYDLAEEILSVSNMSLLLYLVV